MSARLHRRTDELHGSGAPYEKLSDADLRLETVDSDPADNARRIVDALEPG
jgi:adenylylsulfate kinase-like enzyme